MTDLGPGMRGFVELAAAGEMTDDPVVTVLLLKRLSKGLRFVDLIAPSRRAEGEALIATMRTRALAEFDLRNEKTGAPEVEVRRAIDAYEHCVAVGLDAALRGLTPQETPRDTVIAMVEAAAAHEPLFREDIVARDVAWCWVKSVLAATRVYQAPLRDLGLRNV